MDSFVAAMKAIGTLLLVIGLSIAFGLYSEWAAKGAAQTPFRKVALAIKRNSAPFTTSCALCGGRIDPRVGLALFLADSWGPVCAECGQYHDPELVAALDASAEREAGQARCVTLASQMAVLEARLAATAVTQDCTVYYDG